MSLWLGIRNNNFAEDITLAKGDEEDEDEDEVGEVSKEELKSSGAVFSCILLTSPL